MSLSDKEELEIRVKALEDALEKAREDQRQREERRREALGDVLDRKATLERDVQELEAKANELESELSMEQERERGLTSDLARARKHADELARS